MAGYLIRRNVHETPALTQANERAKTPMIEAVAQSWRDMIRVVCMVFMNVIPVMTSIFGAAYSVQAGDGIGFSKDGFLWIPVLGNCLAVLAIPIVGNLADRIGRTPPIAAGALLSGLLSFAYVHAISIHHVPLAIAMSLLMWGVVYQGYNAVFPTFHPELFRARTRVSAMAISQNLGTLVTALLPAVFAFVAPPGADDIPLKVGAITFAITVIAAVACMSARETYRIRMEDLGDPDAVPVPEEEYRRLRSDGEETENRWHNPQVRNVTRDR